MPTEDPVTAIEALLETCKPALTFRHLSAHLQIPTRHAQALLHTYLTSRSNQPLSSLWCVTTRTSSGIKRTALTTTPDASDEPLSKALWAIAPAPLSPTTPASAWLSADISRDHDLQSAPPSECNPLRDGRFNPIRSPTSVWVPSSAPAAPAASSKSKPASNRTPSSLLASVKAKVKAREAKHAAAKSNPFKQSPAAPASKPDGGTLFSTKRLGAAAAARIQAEDRSKAKSLEKPASKSASKLRGNTGAKKARRVIADSDDEEDAEKPRAEEEDEPDDEEKNINDMEREAERREAEEADREAAEREELQREIADLTGKLEEEEEEVEEEQPVKDAEESDGPQSPELNEVNNKKTASAPLEGEQEQSPNRSPTGGKRKLSEVFGLPSMEKSGARRIRKEVEETVEEGGYLLTRRVFKTFDENGNEISDPEPEPEQQKPVTPPSKRVAAEPLKPFNSQSSKSGKKENGKDLKRPSSKLSSSTKKSAKKKAKGKSIMSYFGKK